MWFLVQGIPLEASGGTPTHPIHYPPGILPR